MDGREGDNGDDGFGVDVVADDGDVGGGDTDDVGTASCTLSQTPETPRTAGRAANPWVLSLTWSDRPL